MNRFVVAILLFLSSTVAFAAGTQPVGTGININPCSSTAPGPVNTPRYWTLCSNGHAYYTDASNVNHDIQQGGSGIIEWALGTSWSTIYTTIQTLPPGTGAIVRLVTPEASSYHLTTGTFVLDNVTFESTGYTTMVADSGFTISDTGKAQLTLSGEIAFFTNGQHGSFASQFQLNLFNSVLFSTAFASPANPPFVLGPGCNSSINIVGGFIGGTPGGGTPVVFTVGTGASITLELVSGTVYGPLMTTTGTISVDIDADNSSYISGVNVDGSGPAFGGSGSYVYNPAFGFNSPNLFTGSGAVSFDPGIVKAPLIEFTATGNVSSLTLSSAALTGYAGLRFTLLLRQNAGGTATWPATITNVIFPAGGTFSKTLTANAVDRLDLIADGTGNYWAQKIGGGGTLATDYSNGASTADSTMTLNSTNGPVVASYAALATTVTDGIVAKNPTAATALIPSQYSPAIELDGQYWNSSNMSTKVQVYSESGGANTAQLSCDYYEGSTLYTQYQFTGSALVTPAFNMLNSLAATTGPTNRPMPGIFSSGSYWDGSASQPKSFSVIDSNTSSTNIEMDLSVTKKNVTYELLALGNTGTVGYVTFPQATIGVNSSNQITIPTVTDTFAVLGQAQTFTKSQNVAAVALTDASTVATDASRSNVFTLLLTNSGHMLGNPTNLVAGGTYVWLITQPAAAGPDTLSYASDFKWQGGSIPTLTITNNAVDMISCIWNGTILACVFAANFS